MGVLIICPRCGCNSGSSACCQSLTCISAAVRRDDRTDAAPNRCVYCGFVLNWNGTCPNSACPRKKLR